MRLCSVAVAMWMSVVAAGAQTTPAPLTLTAALERARAASPALAAADARLEAATGAAGAAGRWPNPITEFRTENFWSGAQGGLPLDSFATVTQGIELGGDRGARKAVAAAAREGTRASHAAVAADVDLRVVRRYIEAVRGRDIERALRAQLASLDELLRIQGRRVQEGTAAEGDLFKLEAERARVEIDRARSHLAAARAFQELIAWLGPGPPVTIDALVMPGVPAMPGPLDEAALAIALERRADVMAARARLVEAREAVRVEDARKIPDLFVTGGWKRTGGYDTGVIALSLPVPIFDRNEASQVIAKGQLRSAELELQQVLAFASAEVRAVLEAARDLADQSAVLKARLADPAAAARAAARAAFDSGVGDILRVVDAERVHTDATVILETLAGEAAQMAAESRIALGEVPLP